MATLYKTGVVDLLANGVTGDLAITGIGFRPKAARFWVGGCTDSSANINSLWRVSYGLCAKDAAGTLYQMCFSGGQNNGQATSSCQRQFSHNKAIAIVTATGVAQAEYTLSSFDSDGCTLNTGLNTAQNYWLHYEFIGGDDVEEATVHVFNKPATTPQTVGYNIGHSADLLYFAHGGNVGAGISTGPTRVVGIGLGIGYAAHGGQVGSYIGVEDGVATMVTARSWDPAAVINHCNGSTFAALNRGRVSAWNSNGFSLQWTTLDGGTWPWIVLAIKGVQAHLELFDKSTSPTLPQTQHLTSSPFVPVGMTFLSHMAGDTQAPTVAQASAHARIAMGATDSGGSQHWWYINNNDNTANSELRTMERDDRGFMRSNNVGFTFATEATTALTSTGVDIVFVVNDSVATDYAALFIGSSAKRELTADGYVVEQGETARDLTADALVFGETVKEIGADALIGIFDQTLELSADAYMVGAEVELDVTAVAIVRTITTKTITANAIVRAAQTKQTTASARVVDRLTISLAADAIVAPANEVVGSAVVRGTVPTQVYMDSLVRDIVFHEVTADSYVSTNEHIETDADATVSGEFVMTFTAQAIVLEAFEIESTGNGYAVEEIALEVDADAEVFLPGEIDFDADATISGTYQIEFTASALITDSHTLEFTGDALLYYRFTADFSSDALILIVAPSTKQIVADARVAGTPEIGISADALVSSDRATGRFVSMSDGYWDDTAVWKAAVAERTDGGRLVAPGFAQPFVFSLTYDTELAAVAIAADLSSLRDQGGEIQIVIERQDGAAWTGLETVSLSGSARAPFLYATSAARIGWFLLELDGIEVEAGLTYRVSSTGSESNVLVTQDATAAVTNGFILNAIVVGADALSLHDDRPALICPLTSSGAEVAARVMNLRGADPVGKEIILGPGTIFAYDQNTSVNLSLAGPMLINPGAALYMIPLSGVSQKLSFSAGFGLQSDGALTMTGAVKTRYGLLSSSAISTAAVLHLVEEPTNWEVGDRLFIGSTITRESPTRIIKTISGTTITLQTSIGQATAAGSMIINETRSTEISGPLGAEANCRFALRPGSTAALTHATLRGLGPGSSFAPDNLSTVTGTDVVVVDGSRVGDSRGTIGVVIGTHTTLVDLTILRCRSLMHVPSGAPSPTGELIVACNGRLGFHALEAPAITVARALTATVRAQDISGALICLSGGGRFTGSLIHLWGKVSPVLVEVTTGIADWVELTSGLLTKVTDIVGGYQAAILRLDPEAGLGRLRAENVDGPMFGAWLDAGAAFLGRGELVGCDLTGGVSLTRVDGSSFVDLTLYERIVPTTLITNAVGNALNLTLISGSRIANRDQTRLAEGTAGRTTVDTYQGTEALQLTATAGRTLVWEIGRISVEAGEHVRIGYATKGVGRIKLVNETIGATISVTRNSLGWQEDTVSVDVTGAGVIRLVVETETAIAVDAVGRV